jgi:formylglycine-generating enzyme required for sulfatase activity
MALATGQILNNRYRIVKRIAEGGFGAVYRAWDMNLNLACALKENLDTHEAVKEQFFKEATILAGLRHPNLPRVTDHFALPGFGQFLAMDFVEGQDLQEMLDERDGPLPYEQAIPWILQICDAIIYLHSQNPPIIHRDIKPANIKITPGGQAMLVDFGIAKRYDPGSKTIIGAQAVTPGFSPPEQYGVGATDVKSDIYALGASLYAILTGHTPPDGLEILTKSSEIQTASERNPKIPLEVSQAIERAMSVVKDSRFATVTEFKNALLGQPALIQPAEVNVKEPSHYATENLTVEPAKELESPVPIKGKRTPIGIWLGVGSAGMVLVVALCIGLFFGGKYFFNNLNTTPTSGTQQALIVETSPAPTEVNESKKLNELPTPTTALSPTPSPTVAVSPTPQLGIGSTRTSNSDGMILVYVPEGEFLMGFTDDDPLPGYAKPQHTVNLDSFWIDKTEVTIGMFAKFVEETGYKTDAEKKSYGFAWAGGGWNRANYINWQRPTGASSINGLEDHPVTQVSWNDATAYCTWAGRRLPTEAEWEKAARGTDGRTYPWGEQEATGALLNFADQNFSSSWSDSQIDDGYEYTAPVGGYPQGASPYTALDMAGNVWEWTNDWFGNSYYTKLPSDNPSGPASGTSRSIRGGGWGSRARSARAAGRNDYPPDSSSDDIGFRCAISSSETGNRPSLIEMLNLFSIYPVVLVGFAAQAH